MSAPTVEVNGKKYFVAQTLVVLKLNSGPLIYLSLAERADNLAYQPSAQHIFKEFSEDIYKEEKGTFQSQGTTIEFILIGYNNNSDTKVNLIGLVINKSLIEWFNQNNFKDNKQNYLIYQKAQEKNSWPFLNNVLGNKFEQPNADFLEKVKLLSPDYGCIWRYKDSSNFDFLNRGLAFAQRHLPEIQGWCAFDSPNSLRLILFESLKKDNSIIKLDQTWTPPSSFLPNRYSRKEKQQISFTLSREISIQQHQAMALIKQLVTDGFNGEDEKKGQNFQSTDPTRLLFVPATVAIGDRNIFCHTISYEFNWSNAFSVTVKLELDYPQLNTEDNQITSLRLSGKFKNWHEEKDEETKVKITPLDRSNWAIVDEQTQQIKSGDNAFLSAQILSPTYSDKTYSGIYIKHEKDDEMIIDVQPCSIPLVLGSVQKYRKALEKADVSICGEKLAISVSPHNTELTNSYGIMLEAAKITGKTKETITFNAEKSVNLMENIVVESNKTNIKGETSIENQLKVAKNTQIEGELKANKNTQIEGELKVSKNTQIDGNLNVGSM